MGKLPDTGVSEDEVSTVLHQFSQGCGAGTGSAWIRIKFSSWIRIRIQYADPDPGEENLKGKSDEMKENCNFITKY